MKILSLLFILLSVRAFSQLTPEEVQTKRIEHIAELSDSTQGILNHEEINQLGEVSYFPYDEKYVVLGSFTKSKGKKFKMPTSTERTPVYRRYGIVECIIESDTISLEVYQNIELSKQEKYKDYLFIPFKDGTSAHQTYGGGRYLDVQIPEDTGLILDFNLAYNPYCAYSYRYSCPIPPKVNHLRVEILAGEKTPTGH